MNTPSANVDALSEKGAGRMAAGRWIKMDAAFYAALKHRQDHQAELDHKKTVLYRLSHPDSPAPRPIPCDVCRATEAAYVQAAVDYVLDR